MLKLRYGLLVAVCGILPHAIYAASDEATEEPSTPLGANSSAMFAHQTVKKTPGKRVADMQAETLTPARVREALGDEVFQQLGPINWEEVSSPEKPFDSPTKRRFIGQIRNACAKSTKEETREYLNEVLMLREQMVRAHYDRLLEHSEDYFQRLFPNSEISFQDKQNGDQLGVVVKVVCEDNTQNKFFVKTHSGGIKKSGSAAAETVNPKELLTYALLEALQVGPETHFFGRDHQHMYIATKDIHQSGRFTEYFRLKEASHSEVFGILNDLYFKRLTPLDIETAISQDPVAHNFVRLITVLDVLARIIRLTDLQTNGGNYGFAQPSGGASLLPLLKIIDFRVIAEKCLQRMHQGDLEQFLGGEGFFEDNLDERIEYILKNRDVNLRKALVADILARELANWMSHVDVALAKVQNGIEQLTVVSIEDKVALLKKLEDDVRILKDNYSFFQRELNKSE